MSFSWIAEPSPRWDSAKARVIGSAPAGALDLGTPKEGELLSGDWWRVEQDGEVVGYGWMDVSFGYGEVLLAVGEAARGRGVGAFILDRLAHEAQARGLTRISNIVRSTHPERERVAAWLGRNGFTRSHDDEQLVRQVQGA